MKFAVGDRIQIIFTGERGVVTNACQTINRANVNRNETYTIKIDNDDRVYAYFPDEIMLIESEVKA